MDILSALFRQQKRRIDVLIPSVVITEKHQDALEITEHPVEVGAAVSDHAYKRPSEVMMEIGFSGGGSLLDFVNTSGVGLSVGKSPREVYQQLLDLQESRQPFDVITGKRTYKNMLIKSLEVTTDKTSENVLMCTVTLREVIISSTQAIQVADKADMKRGVSTASVQNTGTKSMVPVKNSSLLTGVWEGITSWF